VRTLLDRYYEAVSEISFGFGGTVLQFVGDEVFVVFGVPLALPDHARRATACALALVEHADVLDTSLVDAGLPPVRYGIGVHTGEVVAAHVGTAIRRQYAVFGDAVNRTARLCDAAGPLEIRFSGDLLAGLDEAPAGAEPMGRLTLPGLDAPIDTWRVERSHAGALDATAFGRGAG
jgi:class 3 adenylate cyclase